MNKQLVGAIIAVPSLALLIFGGFVLFSPGNREDNYKQIQAMETRLNGKFDFDTAQKKVDEIEKFARANPQDDRTDSLILNFFNDSASVELKEPSMHGELLIFAVQLFPFASTQTQDISIEYAYRFRDIKPGDPHYEQVTASAELLLPMRSSQLTQAGKAFRLIKACHALDFRNRILALAENSTSDPIETQAIRLLRRAADHTGKHLEIRGTSWKTGKPFSSNQLDRQSLMMLLVQDEETHLQLLSNKYAAKHFMLINSEKTHARYVIVQRVFDSFKSAASNLEKDGITIIEAPECEELGLLSSGYRQIVLEYGVDGKLHQVISLMPRR